MMMSDLHASRSRDRGRNRGQNRDFNIPAINAKMHVQLQINSSPHQQKRQSFIPFTDAAAADKK